jgi:serine/threonine protein kinase
MNDPRVLAVMARIRSPIKYKDVTQNPRNVLGKGAFATVYSGTGILVEKDKAGDRKGRQVDLAIKILTQQNPTPEEQGRFVQEIEHCIQANFPAILRLLSFNIFPYCLVFEKGVTSLDVVLGYVAQGLPNSFTKADGTVVVWNDTKRSIVAFGIAAGMCYLHSVEILHRDLKPANVMLDEDYHPRIGDFGLAKMMNYGEDCAKNEQQMTMNLGTPLYMAPECYAEDPRVEGGYGFPVDVYAYGMVLYELVTGVRPWDKFDLGKVEVKFNLKRFLMNGQRPEIPPYVSENLRKLITSCWDQDPKSRPTFREIVDQAFRTTLLTFAETDENDYEDYQEDVMDALRRK